MSRVTSWLAEVLRSKSTVARIARVLAVLAVLLWVLANPRRLALGLYLAFLVACFIPSIRRHPIALAAILALSLFATWTPIDIALVNVDGPPKLLQCCPGAPYNSDYDSVVRKERAGECVVCSDLTSPTGQPLWYVVW
jgi:hypothetical protein